MKQRIFLRRNLSPKHRKAGKWTKGVYFNLLRSEPIDPKIWDEDKNLSKEDYWGIAMPQSQQQKQ